MLPLKLVNMTIELPEYNVLIFMYDGRLTRATNVRRDGRAWVLCSAQTSGRLVSAGLPITLDQVRIRYKYRLITDGRLLNDGDMDIQMDNPKVQVQVTEFRPSVPEVEQQRRVDRVRIRSGREGGGTRVLLRGLGNLTSTLSILINSWLRENVDSSILPAVSQRVKQTLTRRLERSSLRFSDFDP